MTRPLIPLLLVAALSLCSLADEVTIAQGPFTITHTLTASILPEKDTAAIPPSPEKWSEWIILSIMPHGSRVTKGETLVEFDSQSLQQKIEDTSRAITAKSLTLAEAEHELSLLTANAQHEINALRTAAQIAEEELEYFTKTRRNAEARSADHALERSKQSLSNQSEELRQLKKMYEADDLTEETEEIILTRQKDAVTSATFALELETLRHKRTHNVLLPREAISLENKHRDAAAALAKGEKSIPHALEQKSLALETLKTELQREKDNLTAWQKDLAHMKITAPSDGWFFHGLIENGRWITGETTKSLVPGGRPPTPRPFATFIPAKAPLAIYSLADDATARALSPHQSGKLIFPGREDLDITAHITSIAPTRSTDGQYSLLLHADLPKDFSPAIGSTAHVQLVSYHQDSAITIPRKALQFTKDGFSVSVKLTDGKTEQRPVKRGRISNDQVEILNGLENGQVVVVPAS